MSRQRLTVVLSQAQGKNPAKRALEESVAAALIMEPGLDVSIVPYLYDLDADHTGRLFLESVTGDMVVLGWMYPRAAFWLLDRDGIKGHYGENQITPQPTTPTTRTKRANRSRPRASARSMCRIAGSTASICATTPTMRCTSRKCAASPPSAGSGARRSRSSGSTADPCMVQLGVHARGRPPPPPPFTPDQLLQQPERRWYPVIDYSRCTNCMECLDFCLFGVYGVDKMDRILVENQDNCKKGCPACSRVCPEQAIMFPDYKTPAIAGAPVGNISGLKIDLTKLFGGGDAMAIAAQERDRELVADGRQAVGTDGRHPEAPGGQAEGAEGRSGQADGCAG